MRLSLSHPVSPRIMLTVAILALGGRSAIAQEPGRYAMQKTDTGIARLDTQTGEVTLCLEEGGELVCRMAPDERAAYDQELGRLEKRVDALEKAMGDGPSRFAPRLPTEEEIDQTMGFMDKMLRSFMGIAREFGREWQGEGRTPPATEPEGDLRKT